TDDRDAYVYNLKTTHYERKEKKAAGGGKSSHDKIKDYFVMVTELDLPEASFTDFEKFKDPEFDPDDVAEADCDKFRKAFRTAAIAKHGSSRESMHDNVFEESKSPKLSEPRYNRIKGDIFELWVERSEEHTSE